MTTPAPSPESQEAPPVETPKTFTRRGGRRGMLAFYVAACAVLALLLAFPTVRTYYKIWELEREALDGLEERVSYIEYLDAEIVRKLVESGPVALPALRRILRTVGAPDKRELFAAIDNAAGGKRTWVLELCAEGARDPYFPTSAAAVSAAERVTGMDFGAMDYFTPEKPAVGIAQWQAVSRKKFLAWWSREGKEKYGRGGE